VDSDWPMVNIELNAAEAALAVDLLAHLAALIDADDPDGLRDAFGDHIDEHLLTDMQVKLLSHEPDEVNDDRAEVAARLRVIYTKMWQQLPPEAPMRWLDRRLR
jgi:hypothetical protein